MKCLENLSMVPDECLNDLQKDIKSIINSYIDIEKACLNIFDEIVDKLTILEIRDICGIFGSTSCEPWFHEGPHNFQNFAEFNEIVKIYVLGDCWDEKNIGYAFYNMFCHCGIKDFDFENTSYWFYKDGSNWECWLATDARLKSTIKEYITLQDTDEQIIMLRKLKEIKERK